METAATPEDLSPQPRVTEFSLPPWIAEYAGFATLGTIWTICTTLIEFALRRILNYHSGFKTRFAILWFLWGGKFGPFYSYAMRPIAQDFLIWRKADEPDGPPVVTSSSLLKAALFFLPSTVIFFGMSNWPKIAWRICYNLIWGWPLYIFWLGVFHEFTGIGTTSDFFFKRIKGKREVVLLYLGMMLLQMWFASNFGANLSVPFCAPTWLFSSWIYRRCSRVPNFWTAMISLAGNAQIVLFIPPIKYWYWELKAAIRRARLESSSVSANTHLENYQYRPLETGQIRVLVICREKNVKEAAKTKLLHVALDEANFDCISYTWDQPPVFRYLNVDGRRLKTTAKAYQIIEDRKSKLRDEVIWIDSVCINQSDKLERSAQVDMMCDIYRSAHRTIVWLDPMESPAEGADAAFSLVESIASRVTKWIPEPDDHNLSKKRLIYGQIMKYDFRQKALSRLFQQKYFLRTWIVQEIVFSKVVHIRCSGSWLSWDKLTTAMLTVHNQKYHGLLMSEDMMRSVSQVGVLQEIGWLCDVRRMFNTSEGFKPLKLSDLLGQFSYLRATDPRDKIFGILNLTTGKGEPELVPDYADDVDAAKVFKRTGSYLLRMGELDEVLYAAGVGYGQRIPNLPSWLPDWTSPPTTKRLRVDKSFKVYQTSTAKSPSICHLNPNTLSIVGSVFDKLATVTQGTFTALDQSGNELYNLEQAMLEHILLDVEIQGNLDMSSINAPTGQSQREALRRTLIGDTLRDLEQPMYARPADLSKWHSAITAWEHAVDVIKNPILASRLKILLRTNDQRLLEEGFKSLFKSFPYHVLKGWHDGIKYFTISRICTAGKKFAITEKGHMALVPPLSKKGDLVCVLYGLEVPIILRKVASESLGQYEMVGESYVHGLMDGEALQNDVEETTFRIR